MLYERLDALRAATAQRLAAVRLDPTAENNQAWSERDSLAGLYQDRGAELEAAERNLCFGRLDLEDGERLYVGRLGLRSAGHELLWPTGVRRRRGRSTGSPRCGGTVSPAVGTCGPRAGGSSAWTTTCSTWTPSTRPAWLASPRCWRRCGAAGPAGWATSSPPSRPTRTGSSAGARREFSWSSAARAPGRPSSRCTGPPTCSTRTGSSWPGAGSSSSARTVRSCGTSTRSCRRSARTTSCSRCGHVISGGRGRAFPAGGA